MNLQNALLSGLLGVDPKDYAEEQLSAALERALADHFERVNAKVVKKTKKQGQAAIREALLHLWGSLLGGELGGRVRKAQEAKITAACADRITDSTPKPELVRIVAAEVVRLTF